MARGKDYSPEESQYIEDKWGTISVRTIAKNIGRSVCSVQLKARRLGLEDSRKAGSDVTLWLFCDLSGIPYRTIRSWVDSRDFPIKRRAFVNKKVRMVNFEEFWKWAVDHKEMLDFTKFEKGDLGIEPDWVEAKRRDDFEKKKYRRKGHNDEWTPSEDSRLKFLVSQCKYTYPEIANELGRSEGAVKKRLQDLGIKFRPVRLDNHRKYTPEEERIIHEGVAAGRSIETIAYQIGRSATAVRGKLERLGYKFKCSVPYLPNSESEESVC